MQYTLDNIKERHQISVIHINNFDISDIDSNSASGVVNLFYQYTDRHSGSVVERPLCDREVAGSIPGWVIPKTLKMVLAALSLGAQH